MARTLKLLGALAAATFLVACEGTDLERAAIGGVGGYAADRALGGSGTTGLAAGVAAGAFCDDLTPGVCG